MEYPSLTRRISSSILDLLFFFFIYVLLSFFTKSNDTISQSIRFYLLFIFIFLYEPILVSTWGTVGQNILGIAVRDMKDYSKKINIFKSFLRYILKTCLGWISFFAYIFSENNRTLHDYIAGSIMLYKKDALTENTEPDTPLSHTVIKEEQTEEAKKQ